MKKIGCSIITVFSLLLVLMVNGCSKGQVGTAADFFLLAASAYEQSEIQKEEARRLEKLAQEKAREEQKENPVVENKPQGVGDRKVICLRHIKNGHKSSGGPDNDGGFSVGEVGERKLKSCSINGKDICWHGMDNRKSTFWNMRGKAESGTVICVDFQGYAHHYKAIANKKISNQCN